MTDSQTVPETRPKGSPELIVLMVVVVGPSFLIGQLFGAGSAAIIGGFVALFSLISSMGGSLRANLRRFAFVGPLVATGTIIPRLVSEVSRPAAIVLATLVVLGAGLLPLRNRRYESTALGIGMGTLLGYAMPIGTVTAAQLGGAAGAGLIVALAMLVLTGLKDPSGPTRAALAGLLDEETDDFATAFDAWQSDSSPRWLGTVLRSAGNYRIARRVVARTPDPDGRIALWLAVATDRASAIAESIRSKVPIAPEGAESSTAGIETAQPDVDRPQAVAEMFAALNDAAGADRDRDTQSVEVAGLLKARITADSIRATVGHGAVQLRHALRAAAAVLVAFLVSLALAPTDPLLPTLLLTTFGLVQASWRATLSRATSRFAGVIGGGVVVFLVLAFVPTTFLFPISMVGLVVGMWFITARPAVGTAGLIVMSVGLNYQMHQMDPVAVAIEYLILTLAALVIGTAIGFVVVPAWRPPAVRVRVRSAIDASAKALLTQAVGGSATNGGLMSDAQVAVQQLVPDHESLTDEQDRELARFRHDLQDLLAAATFLTVTEPAASPALRDAALILQGSEPSGAQPSASQAGETVLILAHEVVAQRSRLDATLS